MIMQSIGLLEYAPLESKRFDLKVYRGVLEEINPDKILSTILKKKSM